jgi:hypothetical protein
MANQKFLEKELNFNLSMIASLNRRLRSVHNDFSESDIDSVCESIQFNLQSLYDDSMVLVKSMPITMSNDLWIKFTNLVPTQAKQDAEAIYQL